MSLLHLCSPACSLMREPAQRPAFLINIAQTPLRHLPSFTPRSRLRITPVRAGRLGARGDDMTIETWIALSSMLGIVALGVLGALILQHRQKKTKAV